MTILRSPRLALRSYVRAPVARALVLAALSAPALASAACGGSGTPPRAAGPAAATAASGAERWFPLEEGRLYHYETMDEVGDTGMIVGRVRRADAAHGSLEMSDVTRRFVFKDDGVYEADGTLLLPSRPEVGRSFMGRRGGGARIVAVGERVTVPAGAYDDCVVVEERPPVGDGVQRTTFCAGIGIVRIDVESEAKRARVQLKTYGFPAKLP